MGIFSNFVDRSKAKYLINQVHIASMIEGRIRVIYNELKHDPSLQAQIEDELSKVDEIESFTVNPTTGSVLIIYDAKRAAQDKFLSEFLQLASEKMQRQ